MMASDDKERRTGVPEPPREATAFVEANAAFREKVLSWLGGRTSMQLLILTVGIRLEFWTSCPGQGKGPEDRERL